MELLDALLLDSEEEDALAEHGHRPDSGHEAQVQGLELQLHELEALLTAVEGDVTPEPLDQTRSAASSEETSDEQEGKAKRRVNTRQRERAEILRLRGEEAELKKRLAKLQVQGKLEGEGGETAKRQTRSLWLRVAKSQLERRQQAQIENLKLKHMLDHQVKVMKDMHKLLTKRSTASAEHWMSLRKRQCGGSDADAIAFARLQSDLDERYLDTDEVFRSSCCANTNREIQDARVKMHATRGMYVEFFDAKIVPFGALDAGNAMWRGLQNPEIALTDGAYRAISVSGDTVLSKLAIRIVRARTEVKVDVKFVGRKYTENERVVIVWQCQTDTDGPLCGNQGLRLLAHGWTVTRTMKELALTSTVNGPVLPSSIVQSCVRVVPEVPDDPALKSENIGVLADLVTESFLRNMDAFHQAAEDIAVSEAMG